MNRFLWIVIGIAIVIVVVVVLGITGVIMPGSASAPNLAAGYHGMVPAEKLLRVPVSGIYPGGNTRGLNPNMQNPLKNDPDAVARWMKDFDNFNCSGCHMGNGGGGMGPSLRDAEWIYGDSHAQIAKSIAEGRAYGMPAWRLMLTPAQIWQVTAYLKSLRTEREPQRAM